MKMHCFQKLLLGHEDFLSGMSFVPLNIDFEQPLQKTKNLKFLQENIYLPYMRFLYRRSLFKNVFGQNFCICQPIFKILAAHFATN